MVIPQVHLNQHIENMINDVANCYSELLFNLDEVGSSEYADRKVKKVIVSSARDPYSVQHPVSQRIKHQILLYATVVAYGSSLSPMLVTSSDISHHLAEKGYRLVQDVVYRTRQSLYIDAQLFYIKNVFIPYVRHIRQYPIYAHEPAVMMMDSFPAHVTDQVLQLLGQNGVKAETFPAHTSNLFQELDLVLFGALKKNYCL